MDSQSDAKRQACILARKGGYNVAGAPEPEVVSNRNQLPPYANVVGTIGKFMVFVVAVGTLVLQIFLVPSGMIDIRPATTEQMPVCRELVKSIRDGKTDPSSWKPPAIYFGIPFDDEPPTRPIEPPFTNTTVVSSTGVIEAFQVQGLTPPFDPRV